MQSFILTEGGEGIGYGHLMRCIALYQAFEEKGIPPKLLVKGDNTTRYILKNKDYNLFDWLKEKNKTFRLLNKLDIAIVDSYLANLDFYKKISELANIPVYIDDNKRIRYPRGIVVNGSIYAKKISYPIRKDSLYLLGTKYTPLRKAFWNIPKRNINKGIKNILITCGGDCHSSLICEIINYLKNKSHFTLKAIDTQKKRVKEREMLNLMLEADLCISSGGHTTYELASSGLPTIGICLSDDQLANLQGWAQRGSLEFVGWYNDKDLFKKIEEALKKLNYERRISMSQIGQRFVDGQGARRIVKEILNYHVAMIEKYAE